MTPRSGLLRPYSPKIALTIFGLVLFAGLLVAAGGAAAAKRWMPKPTTAPWQWQLQGKIDTSVKAPVYEVDGFDVPKSTVDELHRKGRKVICYLDIGAWESYRPDADGYPEVVLGAEYFGYPEELWLDIRRLDILRPILNRRFDICARKGFDAVEPDNIAGWENKTGFPLTREDQLRFNRYVARAVHARGMSVGLKNDGRQARQLVGDYDFAVVEQCFQYNECGQYSTFIKAGKAVFEAEYETPSGEFCPKAIALRFSAVGKGYDLFAKPYRPCA